MYSNLHLRPLLTEKVLVTGLQGRSKRACPFGSLKDQRPPFHIARVSATVLGTRQKSGSSPDWSQNASCSTQETPANEVAESAGADQRRGTTLQKGKSERARCDPRHVSLSPSCPFVKDSPVRENRCRRRPRAETQVQRTAQCSMTIVKDSPRQKHRCRGPPSETYCRRGDRPVRYDT